MAFARASLLEAFASRCANYHLIMHRGNLCCGPSLNLPSIFPTTSNSGFFKPFPLSRHRSSSVAATSDTEITPKIPLCEREPAYVTQLTSLLEWRERAAERATSAATAWAGKQDAPSAEDLQTELSWLLDDAVAGLRMSEAAPWQPQSWLDIEKKMVTATPTTTTTEIHLRESLKELDILWQSRVEERVPLQYLTACAFWRDLVLSVGSGVLIPRPETELIIDFAVDAVSIHPALCQGQWADLGTGSGALAIGIARAIPSIPRIWVVDLAAEPAAHAAFNAERAGVGARVCVLRGSWYDPLRGAGVRSLAGIVSNPPYISSDLLDGLQREVGLYEPELALGGGEGLGIDALAPICIGAVDMLQPGGFLAIETAGGEQAEYVAQLLQHLQSGGGDGGGEGSLAFEDVRVRRDLRGVDRFVTATRTL